ncbi:hypothetical protein C9J48_11070 [Photobacterium profundum]|uniref:Uncharacterized protein n=1 Tax=Photobacterium profundum 3TCK TaxID=314280 RepID=Q1Z2N0_9GAMM|nr:hypothetical protein [Photobacterium profundum]EAS42887.1 hypothetical protein P3TCK_08541 [Photobacterium profundum 3TCK]PSV62493.1 hypothetical protein C9J48_11070 [Photobacterium profundum]
MREKFPDSEKLKILVAALERYQANYNTSAYSTMGFWLIGLGWLFTSSSAREFIACHEYLRLAAIAFIWINLILFSYGSYRVYRISNRLYQKLNNWEYAKGTFEHAKMPLASIVLYSLIMSLVVFLITAVLCTLA